MKSKVYLPKETTNKSKTVCLILGGSQLPTPTRNLTATARGSGFIKKDKGMKLLWNLLLWFRKASEVRHVAEKFLHGDIEKPLHTGKCLHRVMERSLHAGKSLHRGWRGHCMQGSPGTEVWRDHCMWRSPCMRHGEAVA